MATLWICEKYAAAAELARILFGGIASHTPPLIVTRQAVRLVYTTGHAVQPAAPEDYDPAYKSWDHQDLASLVEGGFRLVPASGKSDSLCVLQKEIAAAAEIVVATDAGREGEMIAWELIEQVGARAPVQRFWTSSLTENAVKKAAANLLPGDRKLPLYHAALARSRADWIEGLTYTRYFTRRHAEPHAKPLSVGRVQTALAALIEERCRKIEHFTARAYFEIGVVLNTRHGPLELRHTPPPDRRIEDRQEAETIAARIAAQKAALSVETVSKTSEPVDFLSTSGTQKQAFSLWKWSPAHTLELLQKLYEAKLITYPRTECTYLGADHAPKMPVLLARLAALPEIAAVEQSHPDWFANPVIRPASYDDAKLTDHHAIIPTGLIPDLAQLAAEESQLYQLIARHAVANLLPCFRYDSTTVTAELDGRPFIARGRTVRDPGWRALLAEHPAEREAERGRRKGRSEEETRPVDLPPVKSGDTGTVEKAAPIARQTRPPPYFTQASLLDAMVNIDLYLDDPGARKILCGPTAGQKLGIGTGATRAHIIKTLFDRGYVEEQGSAIHTTRRGNAFIDLARRLIPWMADPLHSAEQEAALQKIERGQGSAEAYVAEVIGHTRQALAKLAGAQTVRRPRQSRPRRRSPISSPRIPV